MNSALNELDYNEIPFLKKCVSSSLIVISLLFFIGLRNSVIEEQISLVPWVSLLKRKLTVVDSHENRFFKFLMDLDNCF